MKKPRSRRRVTKWNLFFHLYAICFAIVSGLLMVPLYLRFIPIDLYGAWLATGNILIWLTVLDPGLSPVLQQRTAVAYGVGDTTELNALLSGGVLLSAIVSFCILLAGLASSTFLINLLNLSKSNTSSLLHDAFIAAVIGSSLMIFSYGITAFNIGLQSSPGIGIVFVVATMGSLALTIVLLYRGMGLLALPIGTIFSGLVLIVGNFVYLVWRFRAEKIKYRFSLIGINNLVALSGYAFMGKSASSVAANVDVFVLARFLGPEIAPIFVLTRKASDTLRMFLERPAIALQPAVSNLLGSGEIEKAKKILLRLIRMSLWLIGLIAAGLIVLNNDFVTLWVGSSFFAGNMVNALLTISLIVTVVISILSNLCYSLGNIKGNSLASFAQGLLVVPMVIVGAKYWGILGVAVAPLVGMFAVSVWYYHYAFARLLKLERSDVLNFVREAFFVFIAATVTAGVLFWLTSGSWLVFIMAVTAISVVYVAILWLVLSAFRTEVTGFLNRNWLFNIFDT